MEEIENIKIESRLSTGLRIIITIAVLLILLSVSILWFLSKPAANHGPTRVEIEAGQSVRDIAATVKSAGVVKSETLLYATLTYFHDPTKIFAGTYVFEGGENLREVADILASNKIENELVRITLPEGVRLTEMATIASAVLTNFDMDDYLINSNGLEGYLFPDTYFVPEDFSAEDLIDLQSQTYTEKVAPLIESTELTEEEVLILASIVEREANDEESMKMVAGILQNRLAINMALQADATIEYVLDTPLNELPEGQLASELRELESPYNTYKQTGLPPTPIGNPGLTAVKAVIEPTESDYFYYITDNDGEFHYAETLQQHNQNVARYLR